MFKYEHEILLETKKDLLYPGVVETIKETTDREQPPNVSAAQCWLYNRLPKKWKNMNSRSNILEDMDEDTSIQVTVTRASKNPSQAQYTSPTESNEEVDSDWVDEVNESIEIRQMTEAEQKEAKKAAKKAKNDASKVNETNTKVQSEPEDDPDYWPDDWEDEDWEE